MPRGDLPVTDVLPALEAALEDATSAVLVAPPGAGKTTLVPLALLDAPWVEGRRIVVLEPRRLAARAAARRMASLLGEGDAGGTVGYRVRGDTRVGRSTRIEVVTEGVLTRMLQSDPALDGVAALVFDEFHERSLHADLGLALALQARTLLRPDLRVLVMSATLDAAPVAALLAGGAPGGGGGAADGPADGPVPGPAPVIESQGRLHPVETRWRERPVEGWVEPAVAATVLRALDEEEGDVLVFLPGAGEIRRTAERLEEAGLPRGVSLHPLFGDLSPADQDRAIAPSPPGLRKVVLATSIAETSLTIEGVRVVVDAGLMRVPRFDPGSGMSRLETVRVTRDAADQRRGRAGRVAPGVCYRLWTEAEERGLVPHRRPEILEADLAPLALELAAWGAAPGELRWLEPPPAAAYAQALELLRELEAVDGAGAVTGHGRDLAALGTHPRLAHLLVRGKALGLGALACDLAALLDERDPFRAEGRAPDADLRLRVEALASLRGGGRADVATVRGQRVSRGALYRIGQEAERWRRELGVKGRTAPEDVARAGELAALAYPDRIARRREGERGRYLLRNGRGAAFFEPQPLAGEDWLAPVALDARGREARIFLAAPLDQATVEALFAGQVEEVEEVAWDAGAGRVRARRVRRLGALTLAEAPLREPDPARVAAALLEGVRARGLAALPWTRETTQLRERLAFLHRLEPGAWPDASEAALEGDMERWLLPFLAGMRSLDDVARVDLAEALLSGVEWEWRGRLDALAPTHLEVPSGSRIALDYSDPGAPALAVRIQEVFGLAETPTIAGGRVPLTLKLLSPARRPVQVTTDLASFWRDAYFEVRKDLRGRYPKHPWPENPLEAEATRRTRRRG